jgi:hypothetical protein
MIDRLDRIRAMSPAEYRDFLQRGPGRDRGPDRVPAPSPDSGFRERREGFFNQVRSLPHAQYLLQREQLAAQFMGGRGFGLGGAPNSEAASNAFMDRYLLSPRAPVAVRGLFQAQ